MKNAEIILLGLIVVVLLIMTFSIVDLWTTVEELYGITDDILRNIDGIQENQTGLLDLLRSVIEEG